MNSMTPGSKISTRGIFLMKRLEGRKSIYFTKKKKILYVFIDGGSSLETLAFSEIYLDFYDRVKPIDPKPVLAHEESKELEREKATIPSEPPKEPPNDPLEEFHNEIVENNFKFHIHRNVFSQEFFNFIDSMVTEHQYTKNKDHLPSPIEYDPSKDEAKWRELEVLKLGIIFLLTCVIREKDRTCIIKMLPFLKNKLRKVLLYFNFRCLLYFTKKKK